jgi:hypothetical protein
VRNKSDHKTGDGKPKTGDENRGIKVAESRPQESLARLARSTPDADLASALLSTFHLIAAQSGHIGIGATGFEPRPSTAARVYAGAGQGRLRSQPPAPTSPASPPSPPPSTPPHNRSNPPRNTHWACHSRCAPPPPNGKAAPFTPDELAQVESIIG